MRVHLTMPPPGTPHAAGDAQWVKSPNRYPKSPVSCCAWLKSKSRSPRRVAPKSPAIFLVIELPLPGIVGGQSREDLCVPLARRAVSQSSAEQSCLNAAATSLAVCYRQIRPLKEGELMTESKLRGCWVGLGPGCRIRFRRFPCLRAAPSGCRIRITGRVRSCRGDLPETLFGLPRTRGLRRRQGGLPSASAAQGFQPRQVLGGLHGQSRSHRRRSVPNHQPRDARLGYAFVGAPLRAGSTGPSALCSGAHSQRKIRPSSVLRLGFKRSFGIGGGEI